MLGAAADQFWMQPGAPFQATGLANQGLFFKRLFDKYGVKADFEQRYDIRPRSTATCTTTSPPPTARSDLSWMGSVYDSAIAAAASDRKTSPQALKTLIEAGPYDAADAKAKGLIDKLGQVREAEQALVDRAAPAPS